MTNYKHLELPQVIPPVAVKQIQSGTFFRCWDEEHEQYHTFLRGNVECWYEGELLIVCYPVVENRIDLSRSELFGSDEKVESLKIEVD